MKRNLTSCMYLGETFFAYYNVCNNGMINVEIILKNNNRFFSYVSGRNNYNAVYAKVVYTRTKKDYTILGIDACIDLVNYPNYCDYKSTILTLIMSAIKYKRM